MHTDIGLLAYVCLGANACQSSASSSVSPWAAWYNTWLPIKLTPKGVVFSFSLLTMHVLPHRSCKSLTQPLAMRVASPVSWIPLLLVSLLMMLLRDLAGPKPADSLQETGLRLQNCQLLNHLQSWPTCPCAAGMSLFSCFALCTSAC